MRFGLIACADAEGELLAHSIRDYSFVFKKGRRLSAADIAQLLAAGIDEVMVARLDDSDVGEDEAAAVIGAALAGSGVRVAVPFTGRCNIYAEAAGVALIDVARITAVNAQSEAITVATVPPFARIEAGQMLGTVKIIPFAVPQPVLDQALAAAAPDPSARAIAAAPFRRRRVALIQTGRAMPDGWIGGDTAKMRDALRDRLADLGSELGWLRIVPHRTADVAGALAAATATAGLVAGDFIVACGLSSIVDRRDVIPSAIVAAGGEVERFGMPVEPGNLLLLGRLGATPVVGLPGCASSPKLNGCDWVLERLCAGVAVDAAAIAAMAVGGLLVESSERRPREPRHRRARADRVSPGNRAPEVAAIVLAAGRGTRFGELPKLAAEWHGEALLRHPIKAALAAGAAPVIVVLGHEAARLRALIDDLPVTVVENEDFANGMASSLVCGLCAVPREADAVLVLLGDMPRVTAAHIGRLLCTFNPEEGRELCVPSYGGQYGNPVLWGREFFEDLVELTGDEGARCLLNCFARAIYEVPMADDGVLFDVDEPSALAAASLDG